MKKKGKRIAAVLLLAFVLFFVWRRISKPKEEIEKKALPAVTVLTPKKEDLAVKTELLGTMTASAEYRLVSKISGEVLSIYKGNGDTVKAGEKIALLDNQKQIDAAKYSLEQAKAQEQAAVESRNRLAALRDAGDVSQQEFETVDAQAKASSAQVKAAKLNYDTQVEFANIVSPTDGVLQNSILLQGAFVPQGTQLLSVIGDGAGQHHRDFFRHRAGNRTFSGESKSGECAFSGRNESEAEPRQGEPFHGDDYSFKRDLL